MPKSAPAMLLAQPVEISMFGSVLVDRAFLLCLLLRASASSFAPTFMHYSDGSQLLRR